MHSNTGDDIDLDAVCVSCFCLEEEMHQTYQILKSPLVQKQVVRAAFAAEAELVNQTWCQCWNWQLLCSGWMQVVPLLSAALEEVLHQSCQM
jgi:hypothetical protein